MCLLVALLVAIPPQVRLGSPINNTDGNAQSLVVGSFAHYTLSNDSLAYLAGYAPLSRAPYTKSQLWFLGNESYVTYGKLEVGWAIEQVTSSAYIVNYALSLGSYRGQPGKTVNFSTTILVSRMNNTVFSLSGVTLGTWPYWLADPYLVPGSRLMIVHDFPEIILGIQAPQLWSEDAFTSLPQGKGLPNKTATSDLVDSTLVLGIGSFRTDRLLATYPYIYKANESGASDLSSGGFTRYYVNSFWVGVYDRESSILLAQTHSWWFTDDIMLHSLGLWRIGFPSLSLVLSSTNVAIVPDVSTSVLPSLAVGLGVASVLVVAGALVWLRRARGRVSKRGVRA
jgi:hypothetical protein